MPPPDRWDAYCPVGKVIPRTKFIAFKVPLKESLLQNVSKEDQLSPEILIQTLQEQGIKLGMVIDLTFTYKYYNIQDFEKQSVLHRKIFVKGHQVPDDSNFQEFAEAVKGFDKEDHVIGVHCTHGVNRTGYLICRYLIEEMDFEPEEAIAMFNEARGHGIERENYLADLSQRKKGQSSVEIRPLDQQGSRSPGKDRWRHHRDDHPGWRRKKNHAHRQHSYSSEPYGTNFPRHYSRNRGMGDHFQSESFHKQMANPGYQDSEYNSTGQVSGANPGHIDHSRERYQRAGWGVNHGPWGGHASSRGDWEGGMPGYREGNLSGAGRNNGWGSHFSPEPSRWDGETYEKYREGGRDRNRAPYRVGYRDQWGGGNAAGRQRRYDDDRRGNGDRSRYEAAGWTVGGDSSRGDQKYGQFGRREY